MILSGQNRLQKLRYFYAVTLLLSFFARYSVALGHDCEDVNLFSQFNKNIEIIRESQETKIPDSNSENLPLKGDTAPLHKEHCERHKNPEGDQEAQKAEIPDSNPSENTEKPASHSHEHHNHETCPICVNYVTIDKVTAYLHEIEITLFPVHNVIYVTIPQIAGFIDSNVQLSILPRGPPRS